MCFQYKSDAETVHELLIRRMGNFGLELEENKTRLIMFGRFAEENCKKHGRKPDTFTFLGFTHYCAKSRYGKFRVKRKTSSKKFRKKCREMNLLIKDMRHLPVKDIVKKLNQILVGYDHYYGITDNSRSINCFHDKIKKMLYKWLNRRSQRPSYDWQEFNEMLKEYPLAKARIYVSIYG